MDIQEPSPSLTHLNPALLAQSPGRALDGVSQVVGVGLSHGVDVFQPSSSWRPPPWTVSPTAPAPMALPGSRSWLGADVYSGQLWVSQRLGFRMREEQDFHRQKIRAKGEGRNVQHC